MHPYLKNGGYIRIIQCFLCPDRMLNCKEVPSVLPEGQAADKREEIEMDPLHDLFDPEKLEGQGILACQAIILNTKLDYCIHSITKSDSKKSNPLDFTLKSFEH